MPLSRTRAALCLTAAVLTVPALASPGTSAPSTGDRDAAPRAARAAFDYSPKTFVPGQRLVFRGNIGATGRRVIRLQVHMNRPGDTWNTLSGFARRTKADGSFRFGYRAPSMRNVSMRLRAKGGLTTPKRSFVARSQDLVLARGEGDTIRVDTAPDLPARPDLPGPVLPGRVLTLQLRTTTTGSGYATQWKPVGGQVTTDSRGIGVFENVPASGVYRVRQEDYTKDGNRIGWFASFPTGLAGTDGPAPAVAPPTTAYAALPPTTRGGEGGSTTAAATYKWRGSLWDFGWTYGESITSPPARGSKPKGRWLDYSTGSGTGTFTGTGRVVTHNGQLRLDSQRNARKDVRESAGATMATMRGNPRRLGRWEVRLRASSENPRALTTIQLVPDDARHYDCGRRTITLASFRPRGNSVQIGAVNAAGKRWTKTIGGLSLNETNHAWGVDVRKGRITWFREGKPIGTVATSAAVPDVPMTLRLSLDSSGEGQARSSTFYDWVRGYSLKHGKAVKKGGSLTRGADVPGCS